MSPPDLRYSKEHEWVRLEADNLAVIGITQFAAEQLGDVVFVELPDVGSELVQFEQLGEIESVKAVSELYSPVSGRVTERNDEAVESPELVNKGPFGPGWLLRVELTDPSQIDVLMTADQYDQFIAAQDL